MLRLLSALALALTAVHAPLHGQASAIEAEPGSDRCAGAPAAFRPLRYEEDHRTVRDAACPAGIRDRLKWIPLRSDGAWGVSFGGSTRQQVERFRNPGWGIERSGSDAYWLQRYLLHAELQTGERLRFFGELVSGSEQGRAGGPGPLDETQLDLHQAFAEVRPAGGPGRLALRVGRQEMLFGSQRLVQVREGPNLRLSFNAARASLHRGDLRLDGFVARPVSIDRSAFRNRADPDRRFWGAYATLPLPHLQGANTDVYYLGLERDRARFDQGVASELRHSVGTRVWGTTGGWAYDAEGVVQWGRFGDGRIRAWTAASEVAHTLRGERWAPRAGVRANVASGDRDPDRPDLQTFNALFPRGGYFGSIALLGPANFANVHPSLELHPAQGLSVGSDVMFFWRQSVRDGVYGPAVNPLLPGARNDARYVGTQASARIAWQASRHLALEAVCTRFEPGPYLTRSAPVGRTVDFLSVTAGFRF